MIAAGTGTELELATVSRWRVLEKWRLEMVIGFRSFPDGFAYVVLQGNQSQPEVVAKDRLCIPKNESWPGCLAWVRKQVSEIVHQFDVDGACIKVVEPKAQSKSAQRYQIEAVIQEYLHSAHSVDCTTRIKSQLKRDIAGFKEPARYLERVLAQNHTLSDLNVPQYQEATLAAVSELPGK